MSSITNDPSAFFDSLENGDSSPEKQGNSYDALISGELDKEPSTAPATAKSDPAAFFDGLQKDSATADQPKDASAPSAFDQKLIASKGAPLDTETKKWLDMEDDPDQLQKIKETTPWVPLSDAQHRTLYDNMRHGGLSGALPSTQDVGNFIGQFLFTPAKAIGKIGKDLALSTLDAQNDPYFQEHPEDAPNPNVPKDIKDAVSAIPENIRDLNRTRRQVADGGTLLSDITQEGLGLHSYDDSFKNYLARERLHEHDAAYDANNPSTWGQTVDYLSPTYKPALAAIARYAGPDRESIKHEFANQITDEQASAIQDKRANEAAQQSIQDIVQSENEHPEDKDLQMLGSFLPMGNWFDVGGRAIGATGSGIKSLSQIGKTSEEINAAIKASMAAKAANPIGPIGKMMQGVGNAGGAVDRFGQKINQATENALSYIPEPVRPMLARHLPLAGVGAAAGAYEAEQNPGDLGSKALSFLKGFGGAEIAARVPRALEDVGDSVGVAAGGNTGAFKTAAINPDSAPFTRLTLKALGAGNPAVLDWIGNNAKDYAKSGVQMLPLAVAMGVAQSADPHEMGQILGSGLAYMGLGQAFHKALGTDPITSQRIRSQNMADIQKTLSGMYPESQANLAHAMSWDNVIDASANRVKEATAEYQDAIAKKGDGSPEANEAAQNLANASRVHDMNQRANPQTRQEWAIQAAQTVADGSQLINGPLRAGKNVRIEALTTDQIAQKLMEANAGKITPEQAHEAAHTGAGAFFSRHSDNRVIDPFKDAVVVNMDHVLTRQQMGEAFNDAFHHELGHAVEAIPEWRDLNAGVREQLFGTEHRDAAGNLIAATPGVFDQKKLVDAFSNTYAKNLKNGVTEQQLAERLGLWDHANNRLNEPAVAKYMQEELLADINSHGISSNSGKGAHPLLDWAITKQANNRVARAIHKVLGLGGGDAFKSSETGLTVSPEILAAKRNAVRELKKLNGELSSSIPINGPANDFAKKFGLKERNGDTVSRSEMMANKALLEHYGKDSGLFKTEMQAIITDAQGNPVGEPIKISNPLASEGSWTHTTDESGNPKITQTRGYGQIPEEIQGLTIPPGGQVHVENQLMYEFDGKTPIINSPKDVKGIMKTRGALIRAAVENTPDIGAPNRFRAVSADGLTYRGTLTPLQVKALKEIPEAILPRSIKEELFTLNEAIARNDGSRFIGDRATRIDKNGRYFPFSPKHIDFVPVGLHLSKEGHFLVTAISVSRMFDKLAAWRDRMPAILSPWNGDAEAFFNELVEKYLKNWQDGNKGAEGLDPDPKVAQTKANTFNNFLNIYDKSTEHLNPDRTPLPKKTGQLTKAERDDEKSSDANTIVRSIRLDTLVDLIPHSGPKIPIDYEKAKINWMPAREKEQTKTPEFKGWFGDFDSYKSQPSGVWSDDAGKVSKVVDKSGDPLVVYHGSKTAGFTKFDNGSQQPWNVRVPGAHFFAADPETARTYSGYTKKEPDLSTVDPETGEHDPQRGMYPVFLNIRNPMEHDMEGANWDGTRHEQYHVLDVNDDPIYTKDGKRHLTREEAEALAAEPDNAFMDARVEQSPYEWEDTNSIVREAMKHGHDGAIIRNVTDSGPDGDAYEPTDIYVAFSPEQIKSATQNTGAFDPKNPDIRYSPAREDEAHRKAVESGNMEEAQRLVDEAAKRAGWGTNLLHHGTTHDFTVFSNQGANVENDHGKGFYFTNTPEDAAQNYAGEGPDLTARIELRQERIFDDELADTHTKKEVFDVARSFGVDPKTVLVKPYGGKGSGDLVSIKHAIAKEIARKELSGGKAKTLKAYVKLEKPAVIGGKGETVLEMTHPVDEEGEYTNEEPTGSLVDFADALKFMAGEYGDTEDIDEAVQEIYSDAEYDSVPLSKVMTTLRDHNAIRYATDDEGNLAASELIRSALEKAGYDGIVDNTVNKKFGSERRVGRAMAGMGPDTHHVIAFHPWSIKSAEPVTYDNTGQLIPLSQRFNENNNDIRYSPAKDRKEYKTSEEGLYNSLQKPNDAIAKALKVLEDMKQKNNVLHGVTTTKSEDRPAFMPARNMPQPPVQHESEEKEGSVGGILNLVHFSSSYITQTNPKKMGKGAATPSDMRGGHKTFFYLNGKGYEVPIESRSNSYVARVDGNSLYDYDNDPLDLRSIVSMEARDKAIQQAGFAGYFTSGRGVRGFDAVAMFKPVKLTPAEPADIYSKKEAKKRERPPEPEIDYQARDEAWQAKLASGGPLYAPAKEEKSHEQKMFENKNAFFTSASEGTAHKSEVPFIPVLTPDDEQYKSAEAIKLSHSGNFDDHIKKSIPTFHEAQIGTISALSRSLPKGSKLLDLAASEGSYGKAIAEASEGRVKTVSLDPNRAMAKFFREKSKVKGATYSTDALGASWTEDDGTVVKKYENPNAFDAIHESMGFQFISPDREGQVSEVKKLLKPDGIFLTEQKFNMPKSEEDANELKKDTEFKSQFWSQEDLAKKQAQVGFNRDGSPKADPSLAMVENQVGQPEMEAILKRNFKHVVQYWDSGNFKGYAASDDPGKIDSFLENLPSLNSKFSTVQTPRSIRYAPARNQAAFGDFTDPEKVKDIANKRGWAILTAENPQNQKTSDADNLKLNAKLKAQLDEEGLPYKEITGKYGGPLEHGFLVVSPSMDYERAKEMAKQHSQESVLTPHGYVYQDGSVRPPVGATESKAEAEDYYSEVDGSKFAMDFGDFSDAGKHGPDSDLVKGVKAEHNAVPLPDGTVRVRNEQEPFKLTPEITTHFSPARHVNLEDYADRTVIALPADRMGIGAAFVGPTGAKKQLSVDTQGGRGFMYLFNGGGWAFASEHAAKTFIKRIKTVSGDEDSALVGITAMNPFNHLKNQTGLTAYVEALKAALESKHIDLKQANAHVKSISRAIVQSNDRSLWESNKETFRHIKTLADLQNAVAGKKMTFGDATPFLQQIQRKTHPISERQAREIGISPEDVARDIGDKEIMDVPFGTVVALLEVPHDQRPQQSDFHNSYPWVIHGKRIGYLKGEHNVGDLTSDPRVKNKAGKVTAQPLQTVLPVLDKIPKSK